MSDFAIAEAYGMSLAWVKSRLNLLQATPEVEKQIRAGKIKGPAAKAVAKLSKEHQHNLAKVAEEKGKVTKADIQRETGELPPAKEPIAKSAPECLKLADKLSELVQDNDASWGPCVAAAKAYDKARGN